MQNTNSNLNILKQGISEYFLKPTLEKQDSVSSFIATLVILLVITTGLFFLARYMIDADLHISFKILTGLLFIVFSLISITCFFVSIWFSHNLNQLKLMISAPEKNISLTFKYDQDDPLSFSFDELLAIDYLEKIKFIAINDFSYFNDSFLNFLFKKEDFQAIISEITKNNNNREDVVDIFENMMIHEKSVPDFSFLILFKLVALIEINNLNNINYRKLSEDLIP